MHGMMFRYFFFECRNAVLTVADTAVVLRTFVNRMLPPGAIFELMIHQNAFVAGALTQIPLWVAYSAPQTL